MKRLFLILFILLFFSYPSFAQNFYIKNYDINVNVSLNNIYHVKERIDVYFYKPSYGISKIIPIKNTIKKGDGARYITYAKIKNFKATDFISQTEEYSRITYELSTPSEKIIGDKTYLIEYDYDLSDNALNTNSFFFNLIDKNWNTKIKKVNFKIKMPKIIDEHSTSFSIGEYAALNGHDDLVYNSDRLQIKGHTTRTLQENEDLNINISLPQNYFTNSKKIDAKAVTCILGAIVLTILCVHNWHIYGKDEPIIPVVSFRPPRGCNCMQVAAIYKNGADFDLIGSLFLYLESKGYIKIAEEDGTIKLIKLKEYNKKDAGIKKIFRTLFFGSISNEITMKELQNSTIFYQALADYLTSLTNLREKIYDQNSISASNFKYPAIYSLIIFVLFLFSVDGFSLNFIINIILGGFYAIPFFLFAIFGLCTLFVRKNNIKNNIIWAIWCIVMGGVPVICLTSGRIFSNFFNPVSIILFICLVISVICLTNMPRKNRTGRKILGEIIGFKKFIETVEKHRLEVLIKRYPNYICEIFPYAYALDVGGIWREKITQISEKFSPTWYDFRDANVPFLGTREINMNDFNAF